MSKDSKIAQGFDRNVSFKKMKKKLIREFKNIGDDYKEISENDRYFKTKCEKALNKQIYLLISMIQLRNGSRISEAVEAVYNFLKNNDLSEKAIVKIAKSKSIKYKRETGEQYTTKTRFRKMTFPASWVEIENFDNIKNQIINIKKNKLRKRVLDYLLKRFKCNTHSLRYSFINYMLYEQKKEIGLIAKMIGHSNLNQLVRYTQNLEIDKLMDEDI